MWSELLSSGNKPTEEEAKALKANFESQCQKAARALEEADVLVVVTGAGFSADSGLATYNDVARVPAYQQRDLDYCEICAPEWLYEEPELFYGFWGQCFNDYRSTEPHEGYHILRGWRDAKNAKSAVAKEVQARIARKVELRRPFEDEIVQRYTPYHTAPNQYAGAFFSFTSNVDAHWYDIVEAHEIHDCHGNIETWQCSDPYCSAGIWRAPLDHSFEVDRNTMLAPETKGASKETTASTQSTPVDNVAHIGQTKGDARTHTLRYMPPALNGHGWHQEEMADSAEAPEKVSNWPKCAKCKGLARPAILMFGDFGWKRDVSQGERWSLWEEAVLDMCQKRSDDEEAAPLKICIVEIGCGLNVPTCRGASERMMAQAYNRGGHIKLVRINPDFPLAADEDVTEDLIPIMSRGLQAIKQIEELFQTAS